MASRKPNCRLTMREHGFMGHHFMRVMVTFALVCSFGLLAACNSTPIQSIRYPLKYADEIAAAGARHEVNPYWICAMIAIESGWDAEAKSSAGAVGLMQLMPDTAAEMAEWGLVDVDSYPLDELTNPEVNIEYGTAYLRYLVERYHEMQPAISAYNAGMGNVDAWLTEHKDVKESMDFPETADYIIKVEEAKNIYEKLYPDAFK